MEIKKLVVTAFCFGTLAIAGCESERLEDESKIEDVVPETEPEEAEKEVVAEVDVDWETVVEETKAELTNPEYFDYVKDLYIKVDESKKQITFTAALGDSTSNDIALDFADTLLRRFNSNAQLQDNSIKGGSKDYLGGIYDEYSISIGIAPLSKTDDTKSWYVYDMISKGVQRAPKLQK